MVRSPPRSTQAKIFYGPGLCCRARPLAGVEFIGPTVVVLGAHHTHAYARAKSRETRWRRAGCSANPTSATIEMPRARPIIVPVANSNAARKSREPRR